MNYFTTNRFLFLVPSDDCIEEFEKIDKFVELLNKSGIGKIIEQEHKKYKKTNCGKPNYNLYNMMATVIYCYTKFRATLREMETLCKFDLRVIYLMQQTIPDHVVICDFINKYIIPHQYEIFTMINKAIINELKLDMSIQYNDGTKIEANANKYKFVWKPTTYHKKLDVKIKDLLVKMNIEFKSKTLIKSFQFNELIKEYTIKHDICINNIPSGRGKRLTKEQKNCKLAYQYLIKLFEYEEKKRICGDNRNSY